MTTKVYTHKNFKSAYKHCFLDAESVLRHFKRIFDHQHLIVKKIPYFEKMFLPPVFSEKELKNFRIDVEKIDRLYHIHIHESTFLLICRVEHDGGDSTMKYSSSYPIYVKLFVQLKIDGGDEDDDDNNNKKCDDKEEIISGEILLSKNANSFLKNIFSFEDSKGDCEYILNHIRRSLVEDKILLIDDELLNNNNNRKYFLRSLPPLCNTHKDYKSLVKTCNDAEAIRRIIGEALNYQFMFDKTMTDREMKPRVWSKEKLQDFKINVEKIDRIYYIYSHNLSDDEDFKFDAQKLDRFYSLSGDPSYIYKKFRLICRMEYENSISSHVYVILEASCNTPEGFMKYGENNVIGSGGDMTISTDANLFMDHIAFDDKQCVDEKLWEQIHQSLTRDGIHIDTSRNTVMMMPEQFENWWWDTFPRSLLN